MKKVTVSVPGKVILMGDHAMVHGKPALLSAINLRLSVTVAPQVDTEEIGVTIHSTEPIEHAQYAVQYLLDVLKIKKPSPITVTIVSAIPAGLHLGSSAAVAVGLSGAIMYYFTELWNPIRINELAYEIEKKQHGTPSGGDNTAVTMGGFIWYRKELEFLKSIWQLPFKPHASLNHFFLVNTGRSKESTGEMVASVHERVKTYPEKMRKIFDQNELQVKRVTVALKEGDEPVLLDAIRTGERTLEDMGVVSKNVASFIREIEKGGGAAKILGGGGKTDGVGFLLCYHRNPNLVTEAASIYGYKTEQISLGEEGIRLEER